MLIDCRFVCVLFCSCSSSFLLYQVLYTVPLYQVPTGTTWYFFEQLVPVPGTCSVTFMFRVLSSTVLYYCLIEYLSSFRYIKWVLVGRKVPGTNNNYCTRYGRRRRLNNTTQNKHHHHPASSAPPTNHYLPRVLTRQAASCDSIVNPSYFTLAQFLFRIINMTTAPLDSTELYALGSVSQSGKGLCIGAI